MIVSTQQEHSFLLIGFQMAMKEQNDLRLMEMLSPNSKSKMAKQLFQKRMHQLQSEDYSGRKKKNPRVLCVKSTTKSVSSMTQESSSLSADEEEDDDDDLCSKSSQFSGYYNTRRKD